MIIYILAFADELIFIPCPKAHFDKQPKKTRGEVLLLF